MHNQRWPWWAAAAFLLGAAVTAGVAMHRHWQVCEQSLLVGTVLESFSPRNDFSDECLRRMDGGTLFPVPDISDRALGVVELGATAMMLAALAWLTLVLGMRWSSKTKAVAVLPALVTLMLAGAAAVGIGAARSSSEPASLFLGMAVELTAGAALVAIGAWESDIRGLGLVRILTVLWGATSFGLFHLAGDFMIMMSWSSANWDVPPGTGWLTVTGLAASAVLTAILTLRSDPGQPEALGGHPEPGVVKGATGLR